MHITAVPAGSTLEAEYFDAAAVTNLVAGGVLDLGESKIVQMGGKAVPVFSSKGAALRVLEPAIATDGPMGKVVLTVLAMVAEMELGFIRERQRAGIEAAKAKGVYKGRPVTLDHPRILAMRAEGIGVTEIAKALGCSRGAVYKALSGHPAGT